MWRTGPDLCVPRAGARVVAIGENVAVVGGCRDVFGQAEVLASVELFDRRAGTWSLLDLLLSTPRTTAAATAVDDRRILVMGGAPALASVEIYSLPGHKNASRGNSTSTERPERSLIGDMGEGRMGCQAVTMDLPIMDGSYPLCSRRCVVVVGGERERGTDGQEDQTEGQCSSVLVYDAEADYWRPMDWFPEIPTPRTAMALCVSPGKVSPLFAQLCA